MRLSVHKIVLWLPYIIYPLVNIYLARSAGLPSWLGTWIDAAWFGLFILALLFSIVKLNHRVSRRVTYLILFLWFFIIAVSIWRFGSLLDRSFSGAIIPYVMEAQPVFFVLFAVLWIYVFGTPDKEEFIRAGAGLGIVMMGQFAIESLSAGRIVRITGSGDVNYDAVLLLIAYAMSLEVETRQNFKLMLILVGFVATFSRTGLAIALVCVLLFGRHRVVYKIAFMGAALLAIIISFQIRDIPFRIFSADRFWMWKSAFELFRNQPLNAIWGFPIGNPLPVPTPESLAWLWEAQQQHWGLSGIHPYNFHSFWLRIAISWGVPAAILILSLFGILFFRSSSRSFRCLVIVSIMSGVTMGLFYISNVSIPLILAFIASWPRRLLVREPTDIKLEKAYLTAASFYT